VIKMNDESQKSMFKKSIIIGIISVVILVSTTAFIINKNMFFAEISAGTIQGNNHPTTPEQPDNNDKQPTPDQPSQDSGTGGTTASGSRSHSSGGGSNTNPPQPADTTSPIISHLPINTAYFGKDFTLTATIQDDRTQVSSIYATIEYKGTWETQWKNTPMSYSSSQSMHVGKIPAAEINRLSRQEGSAYQSMRKYFNYRLTATDEAGNKKTTETYRVEIINSDKIAPVILHIPDNAIFTVKEYTVKATIKDNVSPAKSIIAYIDYRDPSAVTKYGWVQIGKFTFNPSTGEHTGKIPAEIIKKVFNLLAPQLRAQSDPVIFTYRITAFDEAGNKAEQIYRVPILN
jgi:hypothetical protein